MKGKWNHFWSCKEGFIYKFWTADWPSLSNINSYGWEEGGGRCLTLLTAVRCPVTMTQVWGISNIDISLLSNDFLTQITYISGNPELISHLLIIVKIIINSKHISVLSVDIMTPIIMGIITVTDMTIFYLESVKVQSMNNLHVVWIRKNNLVSLPWYIKKNFKTHFWNCYDKNF